MKELLIEAEDLNKQGGGGSCVVAIPLEDVLGRNEAS